MYTYAIAIHDDKIDDDEDYDDDVGMTSIILMYIKCDG